MTASEIKKRFAEHFLEEFVIANELRALACSDIVAIDRNLNIREYEIKVSISDLRRELAEIEYVLANSPAEGLITFVDNKKCKHQIYLDRVKNENKWICDEHDFFCPSTFSFLITRELYEKEKERIDNLPYGVMDSETFAVLKPAKHLKNAKKANAMQLWKIAHSQNYKIYEGEEI